jgi:hypothetical protein
MRRLILLMSVAALSLGGCASEPEKQWYKAAGNYTVAEWQRDEVACTKNRVLDEDCVKSKGWIPLSADPTKPPPPPVNPKGGGPRY